ncbi:hypothetical protein [Oricola cellulosilytica]|uniref:DUF3224 family protein n=1 Tax=Oricola cellulosilytica TaxID=1429082 RepID=A0A4R0P9H3_9HYPH|nr:hypothetical protein [Oricola cellulosilytica]TCD13819.1 hypothetical protein E0D97_12015 [Oricola cellulosilytica]
MFTKVVCSSLAASLHLTLAPATASAECRTVAGTIDASVVGGEPVNVLGSVSGDLAGATRAVLLDQSEGKDGVLALSLAHDFVTRSRGTLRTSDTATWTPIPGEDGVFHMMTEYTIQDGAGPLAGATGTLRNDGIADTITGLVTLRYEGELCVD